MIQKAFRIPLNPEVKDRKARFAELNEFVRSRNGWLTSVPGEVEVEMQCLPGSTLPGELRGLGYDVTETGEIERILPTAIVQKFIAGIDGTLELLTEGSTRPISTVVSHAGVVKVRRCSFELTGNARRAL
jgi:hypothetical protein